MVKMVRMIISIDLLPLKLCGKEGSRQRPDMLYGRGHRNQSQTVCQGPKVPYSLKPRLQNVYKTQCFHNLKS